MLRCENSETWRALSRVGYSIFVLKAWGTNLPPGGVYVTLISRVTETTAQHSGYVLFWILKHLAIVYCVRKYAH